MLPCLMGGTSSICYCIFLLADFVPYDAADRCAADCSYCAAARQYRSRNATNASTDRGVFILRGHPGTTGQAENGYCHKRLNCKPLFRFHCNTSL
jgi:hypothetical protein